MLDEMTKARLQTIMAHALEHCEEAMQDHDWEKAWHLMDVATHADHICRKHWMLEKQKENPEMMHM